MNRSVVQVGALVTRVASFIRSHVKLDSCYITGEVSNLRRTNNGHMYFDLKDENGQLPCVMWGSYARRLNFEMANGISVLVAASLDVYKARGSLQLVVEEILPAGEGLLAMRLEQLKKQLEAEGYFRNEHKKPRPEWIEKIAIVTGPDTAALKDVEKTIASRWPMLQRTLFPTPVQGEKAVPEIVRQLKRADAMGFDAILLVRGGGSLEDLFCFNDPAIVKTLYDMKTFTVTGIGHEIDHTLADFAADLRAVTPTAAAQAVTLDQNQVRQELRASRQRIADTARRLFHQNTQQFLNVTSSPVLQNPAGWITSRKQAWHNLDASLHTLASQSVKGWQQDLDTLRFQLQRNMQEFARQEQYQFQSRYHTLLVSSPRSRLLYAFQEVHHYQMQLQNQAACWYEQQETRLDSLDKLLEASSPLTILEKGYALVRKDGAPVTSIAQMKEQEALQLVLKDGQAQVLVQSLDRQPLFLLQEANGE